MMATLFYHPMEMSTWSLVVLLPPLCLAIALVYKTVRVQSLRTLWWQALKSFLQIMFGLALLGAALWLIVEYWHT